MGYECDKCGKILTSKRNLDMHIKRNACWKGVPSVCEYCGKKYGSRNSLNRHVRTSCAERISRDEFEQTKRELEDLKKQMAEAMTCTKNANGGMPGIGHGGAITDSTVNINSNNVVNNNITLVAYGKEDYENRITEDDYLLAYQGGFLGVVRLTERVHFSDKYPEYHSFCITNERSANANFFDGDKWVITDKKEFIEREYQNKMWTLIDKYAEFEKHLTPSQRKSFERWMDADENHSEANPDGRIVRTKKQLEMTAYNGRDYSKEARKQQYNVYARKRIPQDAENDEETGAVLTVEDHTAEGQIVEDPTVAEPPDEDYRSPEVEYDDMNDFATPTERSADSEDSDSSESATSPVPVKVKKVVPGTSVSSTGRVGRVGRVSPDGKPIRVQKIDPEGRWAKPKASAKASAKANPKAAKSYRAKPKASRTAKAKAKAKAAPKKRDN